MTSVAKCFPSTRSDPSKAHDHTEVTCMLYTVYYPVTAFSVAATHPGQGPHRFSVGVTEVQNCSFNPLQVQKRLWQKTPSAKALRERLGDASGIVFGEADKPVAVCPAQKPSESLMVVRLQDLIQQS